MSNRVTEVLAAADLEAARRSLYEFAKQAWHVVEPADPYRDNWHVRLICEALERVTRGETRRLIINIPPGFAKSLLVSVIWPVWSWIQKPGWRMIGSSYSHDLAVRDALRARTLVESEWFQRGFVRGRWRLSQDQNRKDAYANTETGSRMSLSVGSKATGFRGNVVMVDDPLNTKEAMSKVARDEAIYWWDKVMPSRVNDPMRDSFVVIMQRLHEEDLTGHLLEAGGYEHLCLPMRYEKNHPYPCADDPRTEEGELLFPALYPEEAVVELEKRLGSDGTAGQLQQRPSPAGGGMFQYKWWRFYKDKSGRTFRPRECDQESPALDLPEKMLEVASVDAAFKDKVTNDFVAITIWGCRGAMRYLLHLTNERMSFTKTCDKIEELHKRFPRVRRWLIEDKANGPAIVSALKKVIPGIIEVTPDGGKEARGAAVTPIVEAGQAVLPEGDPQMEAFVTQHAHFPAGKNDDMVDTTSQFLNYMSSDHALRTLALVSNI